MPKIKNCIWHCPNPNCEIKHFSSVKAFDAHHNYVLDPSQELSLSCSHVLFDKAGVPYWSAKNPSVVGQEERVTEDGTCTLMPDSRSEGQIVKEYYPVTIWRLVSNTDEDEVEE